MNVKKVKVSTTFKRRNCDFCVLYVVKKYYVDLRCFLSVTPHLPRIMLATIYLLRGLFVQECLVRHYSVPYDVLGQL